MRRTTARNAQRKKRRGKSPFGSLKSWHWISSAICLLATLGFAITGITLNHADVIDATPEKQIVEAALSAELMHDMLQRKTHVLAAQSQAQAVLPSTFRAWYAQQPYAEKITGKKAEWDEYEVYMGIPKPGGDSWFRVDFEEGTFYQETINRGWVSYFNDLHKGRNTSFAWVIMLDVLAVIMLIYTVTGLLLLKRYAKGRKSTWPLIIAGLVIPWLVLIVPAHASELKTAEITITIPSLNVAEYHKPYVAIWLADGKHKRVQDLAVWYDGKMANQEGEKWLKDIRQWWRRSGRSQTMPMDGISGATRRPGQHILHFNELAQRLNGLPAGQYFLNIEAAREVGGREHVLLPIQLPLPTNEPLTVSAQGEHELGFVQLVIQ